jgi:hypothetical protein
MNGQVTESYVKQLSDIAMELPEEKLKKVLAFARQVKEERQMPPLSIEEILTLASQRADELRHQPRPVVEAQYQTLLKALQVEVIAKNIEVEEYPNSD